MLFSLFFTFFKIGLFTFGGGYAMLSVIENICVERNQWITHEDLMNVTVIAESTPGPVAINCATFVGYKQKGLAGAVACTLGVVLPSFLIIYLISLFLRAFEQLEIIRYAFFGIRAGVLALLIKAVISMYQKCPKNIVAYLIMAASFAAVAFFSANVIIVILSAAVIGIAATLIAQKAGKEL